MTLGEITVLMRQGILEIMILSGPILLIGLGVGLVISIIQATTSIQEQTLTFVPKIAAILLLLAYLTPWIFSRLAQYTISLFQQIPSMAR